MDVFILPHPSTQNLVEDHQQERAHWGHGPASVHNQRQCSKLTPMQDNRGEGRGIWPGQKLRRCPGARRKVRRPGKEILAQETRQNRQGGTKDRDYVASKRAGKGRSQPQRNQDQRKTAKTGRTDRKAAERLHRWAAGKASKRAAGKIKGRAAGRTDGRVAKRKQAHPQERVSPYSNPPCPLRNPALKALSG